MNAPIPPSSPSPEEVLSDWLNYMRSEQSYEDLQETILHQRFCIVFDQAVSNFPDALKREILQSSEFYKGDCFRALIDQLLAKVYLGESFSLKHRGTKPHNNPGYVEGSLNVTETAAELLEEIGIRLALTNDVPRVLGTLINATLHAASAIAAPNEEMVEGFGALNVRPMVRDLPLTVINDPKALMRAFQEEIGRLDVRLGEVCKRG